MNISAHLLQRLEVLGVDHVFGIPGDYILSFFDALVASDLDHVAACNELNAGYAADGYARVRGLGAVAVTYGPGSFSLVNAVASAYAERVPVVVICGGPRRDAYQTQPHQHHLLPGNYDASLRLFQDITVAALRLDDPERAPAEIDDALGRCVAERRPIYLEIPVDLQTHGCAAPADWIVPQPVSDEVELAAALGSVTQRLLAARSCVALVGQEVQAYGLQNEVRGLIDKTGLPVASVFSGKAEFLEQHSRCAGIYLGIGSQPGVQDFVEGADVCIWLGAVPSDFNKGQSPTAPSDADSVIIWEGRVSNAGRQFPGVTLADMLAGLTAAVPAGQWADLAAPAQRFAHKASNPFEPKPDAPVTNQRLYDRLAHFIRAGDLVVCDGGPSVNLGFTQFPHGARYINSSYWASIGSGFGFAVGASFAAHDDQRVLTITGDGSFQMTAQELSTLIRYGKPCIVIVINNSGYTLERVIHDGPFNDIPAWKYHRLPEAFGAEPGLEVHTEGELEAALARADSHTGPGPLLIEIHMDAWDVPEIFRTIGAEMGK